MKRLLGVLFLPWSACTPALRSRPRILAASISTRPIRPGAACRPSRVAPQSEPSPPVININYAPPPGSVPNVAPPPPRETRETAGTPQETSNVVFRPAVYSMTPATG